MLTEVAGSSLARVRSRLILEHAPSVGEQTYTCVGRTGGQIAHASTVVTTSASDVFPSGPNERHSKGNLKVQGFSPDLWNHLMLESSQTSSAPRITEYYSVLLQSIGSTVLLPCHAVGRPRPAVHWVDPNENIITGHGSRYEVLPTGELLIQRLKWDDMGAYKCVAENSMGKDEIPSFIYPMSVSSN